MAIVEWHRRSLLPADASSLVDDDHAEPAGKGLGITELVKLSPRGEKRLLRGILRKIRVAQDRERASIGHVLKIQNERAVRVVAFDQGGGRGYDPGYQRPMAVLLSRTRLHICI